MKIPVVGASFPKVSRISSAISLPRKKRSTYGTLISTPRLENFAGNQQLVSELFTERRSEWSFHDTSDVSSRFLRSRSFQLDTSPLVHHHCTSTKLAIDGTPALFTRNSM